ncbi:MAG TPA: type II toxin-antitoxin system VapC family toxin [Candidatus Solibacter sp.]|nr:type II toxin-antitoxin system VapC family toxin [Candidatus Solibacter sp.]
MKFSGKAYVLDANAILDYVQQGPGFGTVERLFREAFRGQAALTISVINLGEAFYSLWRLKGEQKARQVVDQVALLPIKIAPIDLPLALRAGELKAVHKIPYADSIAAALAITQSATVVTSDPDFEKLGRRFPVLWLPR